MSRHLFFRVPPPDTHSISGSFTREEVRTFCLAEGATLVDNLSHRRIDGRDEVDPYLADGFRDVVDTYLADGFTIELYLFPSPWSAYPTEATLSFQGAEAKRAADCFLFNLGRLPHVGMMLDLQHPQNSHRVVDRHPNAVMTSGLVTMEPGANSSRPAAADDTDSHIQVPSPDNLLPDESVRSDDRPVTNDGTNSQTQVSSPDNPRPLALQTTARLVPSDEPVWSGDGQVIPPDRDQTYIVLDPMRGLRDYLENSQTMTRIVWSEETQRLNWTNEPLRVITPDRNLIDAGRTDASYDEHVGAYRLTADNEPRTGNELAADLGVTNNFSWLPGGERSHPIPDRPDAADSHIATAHLSERPRGWLPGGELSQHLAARLADSTRQASSSSTGVSTRWADHIDKRGSTSPPLALWNECQRRELHRSRTAKLKTNAPRRTRSLPTSSAPAFSPRQSNVAETQTEPVEEVLRPRCTICYDHALTFGFKHGPTVHACLCTECAQAEERYAEGTMSTCYICRKDAVLVRIYFG
jgi:hypothetical protein